MKVLVATSKTVTIAAAFLLAVAGNAVAQNPSQLLQGLLSGNQGQDQSVREAFERGYRQGREDERRAGRGDDRRPQQRAYPDDNGRSGGGYPPNTPYNR